MRRPLLATLLVLLTLPRSASAEEPVPATAAAPDGESIHWAALAIAGDQVLPGQVQEISLRTSESFAGAAVEVPIVVVRGEKPGPTLCLTAGVHGDELNGIEIVRQVLAETSPKALAGTIVGLPIVNLHGFQTSSRYLPDRRDLNRHFPGTATGSSAARIAHAVFAVLRGCNALIDLHTGSLHRGNLPQVRADLNDAASLELAKASGATVIVHNKGLRGTLRRAAQDAGIPAIIYEAGEPMRFQRPEIRRGVIGVRNVIAHLKMQRVPRVSLGEQRIYYATRWVRAEAGGVLVGDVRLGDTVREGDILGTITDPIRKEKSVVVSPVRGRVIGMVLAPVMIPGYATFHIGLTGPRSPQEEPEPETEGEPDARPE